MSENVKKSIEKEAKNTKKKTSKSTEKKNAKKKSDVKPLKKDVKKKNIKVSDNTEKKINAPINAPEITLEEAESFYHVSLIAQAVCVIGIFALSVLGVFENSFTVPIEVLVGITLLIMAYNNFKLFKRKGLTLIYVIFGVISFIIGILGYFGVNF